MSNIRVYELAKNIGVASKDLMDELRGQGIDVKSHMSTLDAETAELITDLYRAVEASESTEETPAVEAPPVMESEPEEPMPKQMTKSAEREDAKTDTMTVERSAPVATEPTSNGKVIHLPEAVTVKDLAAALDLSAKDILLQLMSLGVVASINHIVNLETANAVAEKTR